MWDFHPAVTRDCGTSPVKPRCGSEALVSRNLWAVEQNPGEAQSPLCFCKVPVGIFLTPAFLRCCRSDKAVEKERQCPLNPAQLDLLSHSVLMPGKNVLMQQLSKQSRDNRARTLRARPLISQQPPTGIAAIPAAIPAPPRCRRGFIGIHPAPSFPAASPRGAGCSAG